MNQREKSSGKKMEVEIISRECIKPSSPTPPHLKTYKFCLFDQFFDVRIYAALVLYYPFNQQQDINLSKSTNSHHITSIRLQKLKQSLPITLASFYPCAGKIIDHLSIDCNDEGIYFIEARVQISFKEFLHKTDGTLLNKFIPFHANEQAGTISGLHAAKIQVTTFSCGGLAICVAISHLFGDATTVSSFLKSWAATTCQNNKEAVHPNYAASSLFPLNDAFPREATWKATCSRYTISGKVVTKRFLFDAKAIAILKAKATSSFVQNPTRTEVVSAFISKCIMKAIKKKPTILTHVVNLREKTSPPLGKHGIGNIIWMANALCSNDQEELDSLVHLLRKAIREVDGDVAKSFQGEGGFLRLLDAVKDFHIAYSSAADRIVFTGVCNVGYYDIEFGWGKPFWVSVSYYDGLVSDFANSIILINTRSGDGIETWFYMLAEDMDILEHDEEFLAFATLNPSPLGIKTKLGTSSL